jgi:hypothetical protein
MAPATPEKPCIPLQPANIFTVLLTFTAKIELPIAFENKRFAAFVRQGAPDAGRESGCSQFGSPFSRHSPGIRWRTTIFTNALTITTVRSKHPAVQLHRTAHHRKRGVRTRTTVRQINR